MDAKDILGLPKTQNFPTHERKARPQKESQRKPDGISREVYALTGGLAPLVPSYDITQLKQRHHSDEKITWQWLPFTNSARKDSLELFHWVRVVNGVPPTTDYLFAKYNKSVDIVSYTDEDYQRFLTDPTWTKEDTDRLFEMCKRFDLRFVIIADRFPSSRSVEELKDRYYSVSRAIKMSRTCNAGNVSGHPVLKDSYNIKQEIERKQRLSVLFSQTRQQESRDALVLAEAKRITESRKAAKASEPELPVSVKADPEITECEMMSPPVDTVSPLNGQVSPAIGSATTIIVDNASVFSSLRALPVYLRSYAFEQIIQSACSNVGLRTLKRVEQTLQDLGVNMKPKMPTKAVCAEYLELRKEILTLLNLQKQYKEAESASVRDGSYSEISNAPKRVGQRVGEQDPTFVTDVSFLGGQVVGKKDQKRKGVRHDSISPTQMKRARKLKMAEG